MLDGAWDVFLTDDPRVEPPCSSKGRKARVEINSRETWKAEGWSGLAEHAHHAWYHRTLALPSSWQGRRILLSVVCCRWEARVFLNGKPVGSNLGASPFVLDVTDAAKPGAENELLIVASDVVAFLKDRDKDLDRLTSEERKTFFARWGSGMSSPKLANRWIYRQNDWVTGFRLGLQGGWLYAENSVYLPDAFVKPSFRKKNLEVDMTVRNKSARDAACAVSARVLDAEGKTVLNIPGREVRVAAGKDAGITLSQSWQDPHLWETDDPYLHTVICELTQNGKLISSRKTEFGFREFWSEGDQYVLNGKRIHLFSKFSAYWFDPEASLRELRAEGYNSVLLVTGRPPQYVFDFFDKNGVVVELDSNVEFESGHRQADRTDPRYWGSMKNDMAAMVRQYRNHAGIVKWGLSNEYYVAAEQNSIVHFSEIKNDLKRRLDDTRLYVCRGDWLPDFMDVRSIHGAPHADYPNSYGFGDDKARRVTLIPNNGYLWKKEPLFASRNGGVGEERMPADKPIMLDENAYLFWMRSMDPLTVLEGESVYSQSTLNRVEDLQKGFVGMLHPKNLVAARFRSTVGGWIFRANRLNQIAEFSPHGYGTSGPYANPDFKDHDQLYQAMFDDVFEPVTFYVHTFSEHYYAKETAVFSVSLHNDSRREKRLVLKWNAGVHARGERAYQLGAGMMREDTIPLELASGSVHARTSIDINFQLLEEGREIKVIRKTVQVFPVETAKIRCSGVRPLLYDPAGLLGKALQACGVDCTSVKDLHALGDAANGTALLVGPGALADQPLLVGKSLVEFARQGGRVVLFRQPEPPNWIPARMPLIDNSVDSTIAFVAAPAHPLFQGLGPNDFKFWRGDRAKLLDWNAVSLNNYLIPSSGNFVPLLMAGGPGGLVYSPLIEFFVGRGSILGCQLLLTEKLGREPVADLLFRNLLHDVTGATGGRHLEASGLVAGADREGVDLMRQAGLSMVTISPSAIGPASQSVIFVHASALHSVEASGLRQRLRSGGTVFVYGLSTTDQVKELGAKVGLVLTAEPCSRNDLPLSKSEHWAENPLLQGVNNGQFFWAKDASMSTGGGETAAMKFIYDRSVADIVLTHSSAASLIGHGDRSVLAAMPVETGRLILSTLRWDKRLGPDAATRTMRLLSILATNLGIEVDPSGGVLPVDPANTFQVDLRRFANMGFADDAAENGKGGWTDEGPTNDMRGMPLGMQLLTDRAIPFDIIDPSRNDGKSVRLLGCKKNSLPKQVGGIPVGRKAAKLYFLHACGWAGESAKYVVHYADGSAVAIPIVNGMNIGDWWSSAPRSRASLVPVINNYHMYKTEGNADFTVVKATRYLSCYAWDNPQPEKVIQTIDLEADAQAARFVLVAITGQIKPDLPKSGMLVSEERGAFKVQNASGLKLMAGLGGVNVFGVGDHKTIYFMAPFIDVLGKEYYAQYADRKPVVAGELKDGVWKGSQRAEFDVEGVVAPVECTHEMTDAAGDRVEVRWTQPGDLQARGGHVLLKQLMYWDIDDGRARFATSGGLSGSFSEDTSIFGQDLTASPDPEQPSFVLTTEAGQSIQLFLEPGTRYKISALDGKNANQPAKSILMYLYPTVSQNIQKAAFDSPLTWWYRIDCEPAGKQSMNKGSK